MTTAQSAVSHTKGVATPAGVEQTTHDVTEDDIRALCRGRTAHYKGLTETPTVINP